MRVCPLPIHSPFGHKFTNIITEHQNPRFHPFLKPSDTAGVFTETLDRRFDNMDDSFSAKLLDAMRWEDKQLRTAIDKAQLDAWYRTTRECAEKTVAVTYARLTAAQQAEDEQARERLKDVTQASESVDGYGDGYRFGSVEANNSQVEANGMGSSAMGTLIIGERRMPGGLFAL